MRALDAASSCIGARSTQDTAGGAIQVEVRPTIEALAVLPRHHVEQHVEEEDDGYGSRNDFCSGTTAVPEDVVGDDARSCVQSYRIVDR